LKIRQRLIPQNHDIFHRFALAIYLEQLVCLYVAELNFANQKLAKAFVLDIAKF
jgi:hypothetical protein